MKWMRFAAETVRRLSEPTKIMLLFCGVYMLLTLVAAAAVRICAGSLLGYGTALELSAGLFAAIRPCVGVTALGALLTEGLHTA